MKTGRDAAAALADAPAIRHAGRELLSLALMAARNAVLSRLGADESPPTLRSVLRAGWFQEHWITTQLQRERGEAADAAAPRLAGIEPRLRGWLEGEGEGAPPAAADVRAYLAATLEQTLDLLGRAVEDDVGLYVYRLALHHEDRLFESLHAGLRGAAAPVRAPREALWLPAQRWPLGSMPGGYVPHGERWVHEVVVPEGEIDALPVTWAQYAEFAADRGYDRRELWSDVGWAWQQAEGRRSPQGVEQFAGGVVLEREGALQRAHPNAAASHVCRHEAEAWCRWAGRRLPTEPEWERAACSAAGRGFAWGDVLEWWPAARARGPGRARCRPARWTTPPPPAPAPGCCVVPCRRRRRAGVTPRHAASRPWNSTRCPAAFAAARTELRPAEARPSRRSLSFAPAIGCAPGRCRPVPRPSRQRVAVSRPDRSKDAS